jgi:hypothetical protein
MTQADYPKLTPAEWLEQRETHMEKHSAWVKDGVVIMANNCDPYYTEAFETREEVERFINYLLQKTDEAWPSTENSIIFSSQSEEVVRLDKEGFHYKGEFIADAGEAHRLMVAFLKQNTAQPEQEGPADEELLQVFDTGCLSEGGTVDEIHLRGLHAVLARWGK